MTKKNHCLANTLWEKLRESVLFVEDTDIFKVLETVRSWLSQSAATSDINFSANAPTLLMLIQGKEFQLGSVALEAVQHFKSVLKSSPFTFESLDDLVGVLDELIQRIVVFTKFEDCPICQEGFLGYWIDTETKTLVLCCPECGYQQDSAGNRWIAKGILLPALKEDFSNLKIQQDRSLL